MTQEAVDQNVSATFWKDDSDKTMVKIQVVGEPDFVVHKLRDEHIKRFPDAYQRWRSEIEGEGPTGTPLSMLDFFNKDPQAILLLQAINITSVEQLAKVHDGQLSHIQGGVRVRQAAQTYLKAEEFDAKEAELQEMRGRIAQLEANQKKPPGRPKKIEEGAEEAA